MVALLYRPLVIALLPIALMACMSSGPIVAEARAPAPLGIDLGPSGPVVARPEPRAFARATRGGGGHAASARTAVKCK